MSKRINSHIDKTPSDDTWRNFACEQSMNQGLRSLSRVWPFAYNRGRQAFLKANRPYILSHAFRETSSLLYVFTTSGRVTKQCIYGERR